MKKQEDPLDAIHEIRAMMDQATRFKSISGLSGLLAGVLAIVCVFSISFYWGINPWEAGALDSLLKPEKLESLLLSFGCLLFVSVGIGILMSIRNARLRGHLPWDNAAKRLAINLSIPVVVGGIFSGLLIRMGYPSLVVPVTLLFYGMALLHASKFTLGVVRTVGIGMLILGLLATWFLAHGLLIWTLGFGLVHVVSGVIIYFQYERA
jgi:hypothetical protein